MILVGLHGTFSGVGAILLGWHKLEVHTFAVHEGFETDRAFFVEHLEYGVEVMVSDMVLQGGIVP